MPIKNNAKKALRQSMKRKVQNDVVKKAYKLAVKTAKKAVAQGEKDITEKVRLAQKTLDKAAKRGVIKKGKASRLISRLMNKVQAVAK
ncbi:MAG: 30S ribosomal protein S20 [Candidatus Magasanikbacteria bacterium]|jgi:ribosomal protein S20|nr:30S ribosomal protein S20 [Candidatus Magasanikbacteria bacterium]MBT4220959.1 30S ribosomal protein S20 [Candidatus Magasanikbacteria bacterium]MBT4350239.1 30S ribosomal protein S20 [Candidatus Magasanikbacteria bacterium]MBT4541895.1 30S ribosomal protein S20 [Candidatus Magasanikbacteria bacterium]MBT6252864.1 30S ribosomal protein S20 [Candidatus Magasanikbacteria bacterium]